MLPAGDRQVQLEGRRELECNQVEHPAWLVLQDLASQVDRQWGKCVSGHLVRVQHNLVSVYPDLQRCIWLVGRACWAKRIEGLASHMTPNTRRVRGPRRHKPLGSALVALRAFSNSVVHLIPSLLGLTLRTSKEPKLFYCCLQLL